MTPTGRRWIVVGWAAFCLACSETPEGSIAALYGVGNLVAVDDLVLTLSTDKNELRALSLSSSPRVRGPHFVPAVNPLEPLSIPVLDYPNILAGDLRWEDWVLDSGERIPQGRVEGGPFVYAASHGRRDISIVGGSRAWLKEVKRFPTAAPVTAMAAYRGGDHSKLFFATYESGGGRLHLLELKDEQTVHKASPGDLSARPIEIQDASGADIFQNRVITALSVLPGGGLAIALRGAGGGAGAALYVLDDTQALQKEVPLGQAFRMLATHAAARHAEHSDGLLPAGKWLYALLDEGSCEEEPCESGIVAVDVEKGALVLDITGSPIASVGGRPISMGFAPVTFRDREAGIETETLAGMYVTGSGLIGMFDAAIPGPLQTTRTRAESAKFFSPNEAGELVEATYIAGPLLNADGTPAVHVANGASFNETVLVGARVFVPGVVLETSALRTTATDVRLEPVANPSRIQPGDMLEVWRGEERCEEVEIAWVDEENRALVLAATPTCTGELHFKLRAGLSDPYVVVGTRTGYMGRVGPNQMFSYVGKNFSSALGPGKPLLSIEFGSASSLEVPFNARWELVLTSGYSGPSRDIQSISRCSTRIAAGVWIDSVRKKAYISFSSSNALVEIGIEAWVEAGLGEAEVVCYR